jgi:flavin-dependent dehydrogenase
VKTEVVIVGGGPGGAAAAMFLIEEGIKPIIVEKVPFPRYHVGESMTGEAARAIQLLGLEDKMMSAGHPIKHGVKVYGGSHTTWFVPVTSRDKDWNLSDAITWQVRRSDFDQMMLEEAEARGATVLPGKASNPILGEDGAVKGVAVETADGGRLEIESEVLLDCSGQSTWLANQGVTGPKYLGAYDKQIAIFSQIAGGVRDSGGPQRDMQKDNTLIFYDQKFQWAWWIPLDEEVVSVGLVQPSDYFLAKKESKRDFFLKELRARHPELDRRIPEIDLVEDVHVVPNYSYQVKDFTGKGFLCIGDSHRFIDPIYSFGLTVTMWEAKFAAPLIKAYLNGERRDQPNPFDDFQVFVEQGNDVLEDTIDLFWEQPLAFAFFVHARYKDYMTDMFAGRIYDHQPSPALLAFRQMLKRERTYDDKGLYSVPIGSRYHPERAPIWQTDSSVETTEEWIEPD